jgi:hypothetical protein
MLHHRFVAAVVCAALALVAIPATSHAGGLINSLPADGSWVVFKARSELDLQGNLQSFDRELKIASVGKQEVEGEPGRWIELSTEFFGRKVLAKLLIAEKYLNADQNPFDHIAKAWGREGDNVMEIPENRLRQFFILALGVPNFEKPEKKENEKIKTQLGEYECEHLKGESEVDGPMDQKIKFGGELWINDKVPFGLVKAKVKGDIGVGSIETEMEAIQSGKDAKSELPDAQ